VQDPKEAIRALGDTLTVFLKSGPTSPAHREERYSDIVASLGGLIPSVEDATASYERTCAEYIARVLQVRGLPMRVISGSIGESAETAGSRNSELSRMFDTLRPRIAERLEWCIRNFRSQAATFLEYHLGQWQVGLADFLKSVPAGGSKDKAIKSRIAELKRELRFLSKWNRLFFTYKAISLTAELDYLFTLASEEPLAAIWHYCYLDEDVEYPSYNHQQRDGRVYAVRGSWAIRKGLMKAGDAGFLDDVSRPAQEIGCMCSLQWVTSTASLPPQMRR